MKKSLNLNAKELKMLIDRVKKNRPRKKLLSLFPLFNVKNSIENTDN